MKFSVGDRVIFTNKGSWYSQYNDIKGTIIEKAESFAEKNSYKVKMDEHVGTMDNILYACEDELTLI